MYLNKNDVKNLISKTDLTKESNHCIYLITEKIKNRLEKEYQIKPTIEYGNKIVSLEDNYYRLGYQKDEITLSQRYTKYISDELILRTQMTSAIPALLKNYANNGDKIWLCPGMVYRRDVRDKSHIGEPHQLDIWYLTNIRQNRETLLNLVKLIILIIEEEKNTKIKWRYIETQHHYTDNGIEVEIYYNNSWLELLECGLISQKLLANNNLSNHSGLALGLGLDRLAMIIKDIDDIRILSSQKEEIKSQLSNLKKYVPVSKMPAIKRDLSIAINKDINQEELTEIILSSISVDLQKIIESISILAETNYEILPDIARSRLGINQAQKNVLLRIVLKDIEKTLTNIEANKIYTEIYKKIHCGSAGYEIK